VIESADEYERLRKSLDHKESERCIYDTAPLDVWFEVIRRWSGPETKTKSWVIHNKTIPLEVLAYLANDEDRDVREDVASKRKLSLPLFEKLSRDINKYVRRAIAGNPKVPIHILERLADDDSEEVSEVARRHLERLGSK